MLSYATPYHNAHFALSVGTHAIGRFGFVLSVPCKNPLIFTKTNWLSSVKITCHPTFPRQLTRFFTIYLPYPCIFHNTWLPSRWRQCWTVLLETLLGLCRLNLLVNSAKGVLRLVCTSVINDLSSRPLKFEGVRTPKFTIVDWSYFLVTFWSCCYAFDKISIDIGALVTGLGQISYLLFYMKRNMALWKITIVYCSKLYLNTENFTSWNPREGPGVKSRMCPPYPQRDRKRRLNGAVCRNHRIKRVVLCRC